MLIAFVLPKAASRVCCPHIVYQFELGGVPLKTQEIVLICRYTKEEICIAQIIRDSFEIFLKKELQHVEKYLCATV
ncbi:MAG: hypothetical protein K2L38_05715 [Dysosmobacter sp.]|nr:hypothetical protein [Dysosmobacter sp.]